MHADVAEKVAKEADSASTYSAADRMKKMPYTQAVILETMRLRPPAYIVGRCTSKDGVILGGYSLPRGTTVLISPYVIHKSSRYWSKADEFMPERWMHERDVSVDEDLLLASIIAGTANEGAYIPFGAGQRNCVGALFAMMETTLIVGEVCKRFTLRIPNGGTIPDPKPFVTLRPENDRVLLTLRRRS